jgi:hypothetical protein
MKDAHLDIDLTGALTTGYQPCDALQLLGPRQNDTQSQERTHSPAQNRTSSQMNCLPGLMSPAPLEWQAAAIHTQKCDEVRLICRMESLAEQEL